MGLCLSRNLSEEQAREDTFNDHSRLDAPNTDNPKRASCLNVQRVASAASADVGGAKPACQDFKDHCHPLQASESGEKVLAQPSLTKSLCDSGRNDSASHIVDGAAAATITTGLDISLEDIQTDYCWHDITDDLMYASKYPFDSTPSSSYSFDRRLSRSRIRRRTQDTPISRPLGLRTSFSSPSLAEQADLMASAAWSSPSVRSSLALIKVIQLSKNTTVWTWDLERQQKQLFLGNEADIQTFTQRHGPTWEDSNSALMDPLWGPDMVNSGYTKVRKLGAGSFGKVLLVELEIAGELYAMKVLNKANLKRRRYGLAASALDSCIREVSLFKQMSHPNVVELYEVMDDDDQQRIHMVMEYMHKGACQSIDNPAAMPVEQCQNIMGSVVSALVYLHGKAVVHGDIKPQNILLNSDDVAKLSDFGCSQMVSATDGMVSQSPGTPGYTAPECFCSDTYDGFAADMWALGITLFTMLTGNHPFRGCSMYSELSEQIKTATFKIPREILDSSIVDDFLGKLLEADPKERLTAQQAIQHPFILDKQCR